ncbi:SEC10/PgrA surface exclusion domain-containing protein [Lactiplantibacillus pentosus]|uniref:SEC10/PgrA surface exclusion domain-containing protein n=1 Tax=Lactiplantibacillus pentosus TaxID=1589 RepID=UPI001C1F46AB|nr:SEC10/PgrA surface exclusion domain-containing protein [Lactiplantibacillus pentosus]MBU7504335.1 SEC10/PgrA surface exclusion domain-containing protein [Lactiplantibacillus pentosus]MDY1544226.1 SEC10/PgrA surface exclusion domain-containing protein [Lactiplantibacillus pentosus]
MKSSKVISTTALVLGGLMVTTSNQMTAHADTEGQATTNQVVSPQSASTPQASQAVTSYTASQATVASQAASQSATATQSYASQLENDPAKTAEQEQQAAKDKQTASNAKADQALNDAKSTASNVQSQAVQQAHSDKETADKQATATKNEAESNAQTAKNTADANALSSKQSADKQAANDKDSATKQAQSGKVDGKYAQAVKDAQNQLTADTNTVNQANQNKTTAYVATPATSTADSLIGQHDIQSEKNLPTKITDPNLPNNIANNPEADAIGYYGYTLNDDTSEKINGKLTDSQQNELADYAITLINSWRKTQGLNPTQWTQQSQDAAIEVTRLRENVKIGFNHNFQVSSVMGQVELIANKYGLTKSMENLGAATVLDNDNLTMNKLKAIILNHITAMIYQDAHSKWGHKTTFINAKYFGFGVQYNTNATDGGVLPYVFVYDTFDKNDDSSITQTVLTPTSAQTIEASRTSGGATKAQLQAVENDKVTLANAQKALTDATNAANQSIAPQLANINDTYEKTLRANSAEYQTRLSTADNVYKQAIASAEQNYSNALAKNSANETAKIQQAQSAYNTAIAKATATHDAAIKQAQQTYDAEYAAAHDETPAERTARHAKMLATFKANEATKLANLKAQQATDLKNFKAQQTAMSKAADQVKAGIHSTTIKTNTKQPNTHTAKQTPQAATDAVSIKSGTVGEQETDAPVLLHQGTPEHTVSVLVPTVKSVQRHGETPDQPSGQAKLTLPQTNESSVAPISLIGVALLGLLGLSYRGLRRKVR